MTRVVTRTVVAPNVSQPIRSNRDLLKCLLAAMIAFVNSTRNALGLGFGSPRRLICTAQNADQKIFNVPWPVAWYGDHSSAQLSAALLWHGWRASLARTPLIAAALLTPSPAPVSHARTSARQSTGSRASAGSLGRALRRERCRSFSTGLADELLGAGTPPPGPSLGLRAQEETMSRCDCSSPTWPCPWSRCAWRSESYPLVASRMEHLPVVARLSIASINDRSRTTCLLRSSPNYPTDLRSQRHGAHYDGAWL